MKIIQEILLYYPLNSFLNICKYEKSYVFTNGVETNLYYYHTLLRQLLLVNSKIFRQFSQLSRVFLIGRPLHITPLDGIRRASYRASHSLAGTHPSDGLSTAQRCQRELVLER